MYKRELYEAQSSRIIIMQKGGLSLEQDYKPYLDWDGAMARMRGNKTLYARMLKLFLASEEFAAFEQSLAGNDIPRAGEVAHGIKGMTGNLSLTLLFELSSTLMDQLRNGIVDDDVIARYRDAYKKTHEIVTKIVSEL